VPETLEKWMKVLGADGRSPQPTAPSASYPHLLLPVRAERPTSLQKEASPLTPSSPLTSEPLRLGRRHLGRNWPNWIWAFAFSDPTVVFHKLGPAPPAADVSRLKRTRLLMFDTFPTESRPRIWDF
jgi:hypothetical protein